MKFKLIYIVAFLVLISSSCASTQISSTVDTTVGSPSRTIQVTIEK